MLLNIVGFSSSILQIWIGFQPYTTRFSPAIFANTQFFSHGELKLNSDLISKGLNMLPLPLYFPWTTPITLFSCNPTPINDKSDDVEES